MLTTDASTKGWGVVLGRNKTGGLWDKDEREYHINYLEMKAVFSVYNLYAAISHKSIYAYSLITPRLLLILQQIWDWCIKRDICLNACHIPGVQNSEADMESRKFNESTEWSLDSGPRGYIY